MKEGANLNYESIDSYDGTLNYLVALAPRFSLISVGLTIYVTDAPTMAAPTVSKHWYGYSEFTKKPAMDVSWTAPADFQVTGYDLRYSFCSDCSAYEGFIYHSNKKTSATVWNRLDGKELPKGTTFKVQIRALGADGATDWAYGPDNARTNSAPAPRARQVTILPHTNYFLTGITADRAARHIIGQISINAIFRDDDGDTLGIYLTSSHPSLVTPRHNPDGTVELLAQNEGSSTITYAATDGYGGRAPNNLFNSRFVYTVTDNSRVLQIFEQSPPGTNAIPGVWGTPFRSDMPLTDFTLSGEATEAFVINQSTSNPSIAYLSVKEGAVLDYENGKKSYSGQVKYHAPPAVAGIAYQSTMTITINVINITPDKPGTPVLTLRPFEGESKPALDVTWTPPTDNGNHGIAITGYQVQLQRLTGTEWRPFGRDFAADETGFTLWNLEYGGYYAVQVRALSDAGVSPWSDLGWKNANLAPLVANNLPSRDPNVPMTEGGSNCQAGITEQRFTDPDGDTLL